MTDKKDDKEAEKRFEAALRGAFKTNPAKSMPKKIKKKNKSRKEP